MHMAEKLGVANSAVLACDHGLYLCLLRPLFNPLVLDGHNTAKIKRRPTLHKYLQRKQTSP